MAIASHCLGEKDRRCSSFNVFLEYCLRLTLFVEINVKNPKTYREYSKITFDISLYLILVSLRKKN